MDKFIKRPHIIRNILDPGSRIIMVIGGADTGKTTLVEGIADMLSMKTTVGIVDLDMGQSHIGIPTTIAGSLFRRKTFILPAHSHRPVIFCRQ
jgi:polynucleotide 5'-kinase involved in rRNA processing